MAEVMLEGVRVDRAAALAPYVSQVFSVLSQQEAREGRVKITIKQYAIDVQPWERSQLRGESETASPAPGSWAYAIGEGMAVQAKAFADLCRIAGMGPGPDQDAVRRDLVIDRALAYAVHLDYERLANEANRAGRTGQARYLAEFDQRIQDALIPLDEAIGGDGQMAARSITVDNGAAAVPVVVTEKSGKEQAPTDTFTASSAAPETKKTGLRTKHAVLASIVTIALVCGGFFAWSYFSAEELTVARALKYVPGVKSFSADPPLLRVTVAAEHWASLSPSDRSGYVHDVAAGLPRLGFTRADIFTPNGHKVASWDTEHGSQHE